MKVETQFSGCNEGHHSVSYVLLPVKNSTLFQLYPKDPLPKTVCLDCCAKLDQCSDFFETTSQAQVTLHMIFPGAKKEEEVDTEEDRPKPEHEPDHDSSSFLEEVRQYF